MLDMAAKLPLTESSVCVFSYRCGSVLKRRKLIAHSSSLLFPGTAVFFVSGFLARSLTVSKMGGSGKLVEEEEGNFALWLSYILTGVGANIVSWLVLPRNAVSIGASGAVFGLFTISIFVKMSFDWRKILEVLILGQFVIEKVMEAAQASTSLSGTFPFGSSMQTVNHIAHLSSALVGVVLVYLLS